MLFCWCLCLFITIWMKNNRATIVNKQSMIAMSLACRQVLLLPDAALRKRCTCTCSPVYPVSYIVCNAAKAREVNRMLLAMTQVVCKAPQSNEIASTLTTIIIIRIWLELCQQTKCTHIYCSNIWKPFAFSFCYKKLGDGTTCTNEVWIQACLQFEQTARLLLSFPSAMCSVLFCLRLFSFLPFIVVFGKFLSKKNPSLC